MDTRNSRILITGGCGFIGSHLIEHLLVNTKWKIIVIDKLTYAANGLNRLRDLNCLNKERLSIFTHDFTYPFSMGVTEEIGQVDYIVHMGAETHVDRSLDDAMPFAVSNVLGTTNLLEWVKRTQKNLKRYVQFSTDETYGAAPEGVFYKEWDTMKPSNPYAASKAGADMMAFSFAHAFNLPVIITRTMNCVGERQHPEKFVPKTIKSISNNGRVILHGVDKYSISSRCWIHARNAADAVLFLLDKGITAEMYHIVGIEKTVLDIANIICNEIKGRNLKEDEIEFIDFHQARPGHDKRYAMSGQKLSDMGWHPQVPFEESLRRMVHWTLQNKQWLEL